MPQSQYYPTITHTVHFLTNPIMLYCGQNRHYGNIKTNSSEKRERFVLKNQNTCYFKYILNISNNLSHQCPFNALLVSFVFVEAHIVANGNYTAINFKYLSNHPQKSKWPAIVLPFWPYQTACATCTTPS